MKKNYLFLFLFFTFRFTFAQVDVNQLFSNHPELIIKFHIQDRSQLEWLTRYISIDNVFENEVTAYTTIEEFEHFLSLKIPFEIVKKSILAPEELNMLDFEAIQQCRNDWNYYPTYQGYLDMMTQFATDYPELCRLVEFGTSVQNRKLLACVISKNVNEREAEPQVFWSSSMHGDELTGYVLTLRFIDYLLSNYGTNERVTYLLDNIEIWINPIANPDGTFKGSGGTVNDATRNNANGKDLNRNYPDDTYSGNVPPGFGPLQKETNAFIALQQAQSFNLSVNIHGGVEVANYPWDNKITATADHEWWKYVCREYVDTVHFHKPNYMKGTGVSGNQNGIVWGWQWYQVYGGRQDYANYYDQTREFCLEISNDKTPSASQLPSYWDGHYRSFLNYTQQALYGIQGVVTNACTGEPLHAKISLPNDIHNSYAMTDPGVGFYARYLKAGTYTVTFSVDDYIPQTVTFTVADKQKIVQNIELTPLEGTLPTPEFTAELTSIQANQTVFFLDLSENKPTSWDWSFEGGIPATSEEQNPTVVYKNPGTYSVELVAKNCFGEDTITKENYITVTETDLPIADFTANPTQINSGETVSFTNLSQNATAWEWFFEGGTPQTSTEENPIVFYENEGIFNVNLRVTNDFSTDEMLKEKYITVEEIKVDENGKIVLRFYPNPVLQERKLTLETELQVSKIEIINLLGAVVETHYLIASPYSFSVLAMKNGLYILKITSSKGVHFSKILIQ
ncbi:MAG: PKD domain-containing protein [Bacteroidales bacterium]|jgi:PKD repeat protein|nr:PKD domain-containing protein [Bacteroidales bacterium]